MKPFAALAALLLLSACAIPPKQLYSSLDEKDIAWSRGSGKNTVNGQALLRTVGGEVRTCAGFEVHMVPDSDYARERITHLYNSTEKGYNPAFMGRNFIFEPDYPLYRESSRTTRCDAQGNFTFENIPNGKWYVAAPVLWKANANSGIWEGGQLMQSVSLKGGKTTKIILSY